MLLQTLRIQNFRSFVDETIVFDDFNSVVGENGAGKSNILTALNILFRNTNVDNFNLINLSEDDFHNKQIDVPVAITATFVGLSEDARRDFSAYVRHDQLVISAKAHWNPATRSASVNQFGQRLVFSAFKNYFEADKAKQSASELKDIYKRLRSEFSELPNATTKVAMAEALREYENARPEICSLEESGDNFYGFTKGSNLLSKYIQWIYVPAVKDASSEQDEQKNTALGELLSRTIRSKVDFSENIENLKSNVIADYDKIVSSQRGALNDISSSLEKRLREWVSDEISLKLDWYYEPEKSLVINEPWARVFVSEREFVSEVSRLGHGMQRSILISLLQELGSESEENSGPTLLLGLEEPELYQHPPQARHFSDVLQALSKKNAQVIVTTHSPYFVGANGFSSVRRARGLPLGTGTKVAAFDQTKLADDLANALGMPPRLVTAEMAVVQQIMQPSQNELFFARVPVIVEGLEDIAFLAAHMQMNGLWSKFREYGCHLVMSGGKTIQSRLVGICNGLSIPCYLIFDSDGGNQNNHEQNKRDNTCLARLSDWEGEFEFPEEPFIGEKFTAWPKNIFDSVVKDLGQEIWDQQELIARQLFGLEGGIQRKNQTVIAATMEGLHKAGKRSQLLDSVVEKILTYAKNSN